MRLETSIFMLLASGRDLLVLHLLNVMIIEMVRMAWTFYHGWAC